MNRLISAGRPSSEDERQVRKLQFASLIERREAAARKLMPPTLLRTRAAIPRTRFVADPT
jgi:hypothetical protein